MSSAKSSLVTSQIQAFLDHVYQDSSHHVARVDVLRPSPRKGYMINTSDGHIFVLKTSPSSSTKLLRYEAASPADEAHALERLSGSALGSLKLAIPVPRLLSTSYDGSNPLAGPYLLRSYISGVPLAFVAHKCTTYEREEIDRRIGSYMRIATSVSASQFGTLNRVARGAGYDSWRNAFHFLLEAALRDAEDAALTLPYKSIRYWVQLHMHYLDAVTEPKLVPLRAGTPETVLIDEECKTVAGIISWGDTLWGDPALGEVFAKPSDKFWLGFGGIQGHSCMKIQDGGHERRAQIYTVYRSIVTVVKSSSRPRLGFDESDARGIMNWALNELATV